MSLSRLRQRVRNSLRLKLALLLSIVTAVLTIAFTSYYMVSEHHTFHTRLEDKGNLLVAILEKALVIPLYAGHNEEIARQVTQIFSYGEVASLKVFTNSGELVASASRDEDLSGNMGPTIARTVTTHADALTPAELLLGEDRPEQRLGTIELTMDQSKLTQLTKNLLLSGTLLAVLFWIATSALTFFILRRVTATFHQLMTGVKNIEAGDLLTRIPTSGTDEPGRALAALNRLAESLQIKNEENLKLQADRIEEIQSQFDEEKNKHMAKLIQTNRMTSLGLLVSSMAHEINNPNGAIRLAAEILEKAWKDIQPILDELAVEEGEFKICGAPYTHAVDDIEAAVDAILRSSTRIERVVQNLRAYSIGERSTEHTVFNCNRVAENAVAIVRAHGKMERIAITTTLSPFLPEVSGNPFQTEQVVINLLLNAIQAMSANGGNNITLATETDPDRNEVTLTVKDSGPGIKAEDLPHIFEPFFSTRINEGGSGLGLYISNFLIQEQNGRLEIFNDESGGCRAIIRLPLAPAVTPATPS